MSFEELFERYRRGDADETERERVEEELNKLRLLEEYLAEALPAPAEAASPEEEQTAAREVRAVRRRMTRRTVGVFVSAVAAVLAAVLLLQAAVLAPLNRTALNRRQTTEQSCSDFDLAMMAFTELRLPLGYYAMSRAGGAQTLDRLPVRLGFDNLDLEYDELETSLSLGKLERWTEEDWNYLRQYGISSGGWFDTRRGVPVSLDARVGGDAATQLEELPDYISVTAAVSFSRTISLEELAALMEENGGVTGPLEFVSAALHIPQEGRWGADDLAYLKLSRGPGPEVAPYEEFGLTDYRADNYRRHLESLLQCLIDNPEVARWSAGPDGGADVYRAMLDYVRENSVEVCGLWVRGTGEEIAALRRSDLVTHIYVRDAQIRPVG